jgi:hypothetical protein
MAKTIINITTEKVVNRVIQLRHQIILADLGALGLGGRKVRLLILRRFDGCIYTPNGCRIARGGAF